MLDSLEFFLTQCVRKPKDDAKWRLGWWVLDSEEIHNELIQVLSNGSQEFVEALVGSRGYVWRPSQIFDLQVRRDDGTIIACIEIKTINGWQQRSKQIARMRELPHARGFIILLYNSARMSQADIAEQSGGTFTKLGYSDMYKALDAVPSGSGFHGIANAYKTALREQEERFRRRYAQDPSA